VSLSAIMFILLDVWLVFEAYTIFRQHEKVPHKRWLGYLTLFVAFLLPLLAVMISGGILVNSPEFGVIMAQGGLSARLFLSLIILAVAPAAGVAWSIARAGAGRAPRIQSLFFIGICVGLASAVRIFLLEPLNPSDIESLQIQYYDLWWPLSLIWFSVCMAGITISLSRLDDSIRRLCLILLLAAFFTSEVLRRPEFADWTSCIFWGNAHPLDKNSMQSFLSFLSVMEKDRIPLWSQAVNLAWVGSLGIEILLGASLFIWASVSVQGKEQTKLRRGMSIVIVSILFAAALIFLLPWWDRIFNSRLFWVMSALFWAFLCLLVAIKRTKLPWKAALLHLVKSVQFGHLILLISWCTFAVSLAHIFYFGVSDFFAPLAGFVFAWMLLVEMAGKGPLVNTYELGRTAGVSALSVTLRRKLASISVFLARSAARLVQTIEGLLKVGSWPAAVVKTLVGIVILVALCEIPNAGKMIIQPFKGAPGMSAEKPFGELASDHLLDAIGDINQTLRPDVALIYSIDNAKVKKEMIVVVGNAEAGVDAALGKSSDLDFGVVKIPLSLIVAPVQLPVRALLGVRVINGSFHEDKSSFTLLARSNEGHNFQATLPKTDSAQQPVDALDKLAQNLAFQIITANPDLATAGMTHLLPAFDTFRTGLLKWRVYESKQRDYGSLTSAIKAFREVTQLDSKFALAHYRLGLALLSDGQPSSAVEAFRNCVEANPGFVAGQIALAEALFWFEDYLGLRTAAASVPAQMRDEVRVVKQTDARRILHRVVQQPKGAISDSDLARAYYYLALIERKDFKHYVVYFYARRAEMISRGLPVTQNSVSGAQQKEGYRQYLLGTVLTERGRIDADPGEELNPGVWHCAPESLSTEQRRIPPSVSDLLVEKRRKIDRNRFAAAALPYYDRAAGLLPDDAEVACKAATMAYTIGDRRRMENLSKMANVHYYLAETYKNDAIKSKMNATLYFHLALAEYEHAIDLEPNFVNALNNYGYTFWQWRLKRPEKFSDGPGAIIALKAEKYARKAVSIAQDRTTLVMAKSTLGEVLLAQARTEEALEVFKEAFGVATPQPEAAGDATQHPFYDEMRWEYAQACLWESRNIKKANGPAEDRAHLMKEAVERLKNIRNNDGSREDKLFPSGEKVSDLLDPRSILLVASHDDKYSIEPIPDGSKPLYILSNGKTQYERSCNWFGIVAKCKGNNTHQNLKLHIWGGGVDQYIVMGKDSSYAFLGHESKETRHYYHAQLGELRDGGWKPVSMAYPIPTRANKNPDKCDKNLIRLVFERIE
jgi:tetratricopeptide (TPR) repeat protein